MKVKIILLILNVLVGINVTTAQKRTISARIVSATDSIPMEFATVRLMQPDSIMVSATLTDINGRFRIDIPLEVGMYLSISSVGCQSIDVALPCDTTIYLENLKELSEVVVRGSKRYVKATNRGLHISMTGNPIAQLGSAADALKHLPLIDGTGGKISVLGHGIPVIYINGRKVISSEELTLLSANDIANVEIITNPSAKYGADVTSVIVIHTKKTNAGFHAVAGGNVSASEEWSESANATLNYHTESGLTFFGDFSYGFSGFKQKRNYSERFYSFDAPENILSTSTYAKARTRSQALSADGGVNYDFEKNSIGVKYSFDRTPENHYTGNALSLTNAYDRNTEIKSVSELFSQNSMHHVNTFGNFTLPASFGLRFDGDYVFTNRKSRSSVNEGIESDVIGNSNIAKGHLWSGKILLSKKLGKVELEAGSDLSHTSSNQNFIGYSSDDLSFLKPEQDNVRQNLYAGYLSFDWNPNSEWNIYGGLRLESTNTDFTQNGLKIEALSKNFSDWLPNVGVSFNSPIRMTLYYRASVSRPGYQSLDNTYVYVTPTLWETGNAGLQSTLRHKVGLNLSYKKFMLQSSLTVNKRGLASIYQYDETDRINVIKPINLPTYYSFQTVAVQQLDFSFWHPTLQGVFYVQNLKYGNPQRKYNKPLYTLALNNRFDIPGGLYAYLNFFMLGSGNQDVLYSNGSWQTSLTLNKTWKNWTFTLSANDIFKTWRQKFDTTTNTVAYSSDITGASQSVSLTIRYTLNSAKGKYKGKTSRQDEIDRL